MRVKIFRSVDGVVPGDRRTPIEEVINKWLEEEGEIIIEKLEVVASGRLSHHVTHTFLYTKR